MHRSLKRACEEAYGKGKPADAAYKKLKSQLNVVGIDRKMIREAHGNRWCPDFPVAHVFIQVQIGKRGGSATFRRLRLSEEQVIEDHTWVDNSRLKYPSFQAANTIF